MNEKIAEKTSLEIKRFINARGDEAFGTTWSYLDMTALGRKEKWEDSPQGYPQTSPYEWWNWNDDYTDAPPSEDWSAAVERGIQAGQGRRRSGSLPAGVPMKERSTVRRKGDKQ